MSLFDYGFGDLVALDFPRVVAQIQQEAEALLTLSTPLKVPGSSQPATQASTAQTELVSPAAAAAEILGGSLGRQPGQPQSQTLAQIAQSAQALQKRGQYIDLIA